MTEEYIDPTINPAQANAQIEAIMKGDDPPAAEIPAIEPPRDGFVRLPGGLELDDRMVYEVEVQELTGAHEERLAKARISGGVGRYLQTLLQCGVVEVGGTKVTDQILNSLLVGDRDYLIMAISQATYGPEIDVGHGRCEECGQAVDLVINTEDIPVRTMTEGDRQFDVPLRKGGSATVRLPTGSDQLAYLEDLEMTDSERNSVLLGRCVLALTDKDGDRMNTAGFPSMVRDGLGILDRRAILNAISERQPGPRYDEAKYTHECGAKIDVTVGLVHLFPEL